MLQRFQAIRRLHGLPSKTDEYREHAIYPTFEPVNSDTNMNNLINRMKTLKSVEEKLYYLNKPKYYGWYSLLIDSSYVPFDSHNFIKFATWTHVERGLPSIYDNPELNRIADEVTSHLETRIKELLINIANIEWKNDVQLDKIEYNEVKVSLPTSRVHIRHRLDAVVQGINRLIISELSSRGFSHLLNAQIDINPRNEAFWFRSDILPDKSMIKKREGTRKFIKENYYRPDKLLSDQQIRQPYDRCIQYTGDPILQIRCTNPILPFAAIHEDLCMRQDIPIFNHDPRTLGYKYSHQSGTNISSYWSGSKYTFSNISYIDCATTRPSVYSPLSFEPNCQQQELRRLSQAILSSFGLLLAQACHLGYSPLYDPSHPLSTQTIVTDGKMFQLHAYQLNKTALQIPNSTNYSHCNVMWQASPQELYSSIDASGQLIGFNSSLLRDIIKMYVLKPSDQLPETPFLDVNRKYLHHIKNNYNREYFFNLFRHLYSKRPRHFEKPNIQYWEKLFRIDHPKYTFIEGSRERPWYQMARIDFLGKEHWHPEFRHLDYFCPAHKPKKFRRNQRDKFVKKVVPPIDDDNGDAY